MSLNASNKSLDVAGEATFQKSVTVKKSNGLTKVFLDAEGGNSYFKTDLRITDHGDNPRVHLTRSGYGVFHGGIQIRDGNDEVITHLKNDGSAELESLLVGDMHHAQPQIAKAHINAVDQGSLALNVAGAVHIGNVDEAHDYSSVASRDDVLLFVEEGIATEDMTYIFADDWDAWPDYVFEEDYNLSNLDDLEAYILKHKHLPGVISQQEVKENGVSDKQMNITLLEKIEELTLYTIQQDNKLQAQEKLNATLMEGLKALEEKVNSMSNNR